MHNLKELRKNLEIFKKKLKERNVDFNIEEFSKLDKINRELISKKENFEQEKKFCLNPKMRIIMKNQNKYQNKSKK